jgi:hypothetical protein
MNKFIYKVIDDILPTYVFQNLQNKIINDTFPFYFSNKTVNKHEDIDNISKDFSFYHVVCDSSYKSHIFPCLEVCLLSIFDKIHIEHNEIIRIRIGLITNIGEINVHKPHVDCDFPNYYTGLLYLNDSDGETFIYNEVYDDSYGIGSFDYIKTILNNNLSVKEKIKPKQNRLLLMNGNVFHSSSNPISVSARYTINFNFTTRQPMNLEEE